MNKDFRETLIQIERIANMCRIWGGMSWEYHPMIPSRVKRITELCRKALDENENSDN
jgi:hypothetical protein